MPRLVKHATAQEANGSKGGLIFRNTDDPSEVIVLLEWNSLKTARQFAQSDDLREKIREVGVI